MHRKSKGKNEGDVDDRRKTKRSKAPTTTTLQENSHPDFDPPKRARVQCMTHQDVGVSAAGLTWLERQVANRLDEFLGPFTPEELKQYDVRKVNAVKAEEGQWVRSVIDSFRTKFKLNTDPPEEQLINRQFCNIYNFLLRSYINYAIMRSHAVNPPKEDTSRQRKLAIALLDAIQRDFGSPSLLGMHNSWPTTVPDACPFVHAATTYISFIHALVSMGSCRYTKWLQQKQDSMQQFAKSFAHAVEVDNGHDGTNLIGQL